MNRRSFISSVAVFFIASTAVKFGAKAIPKLEAKYPHLAYERCETNDYTGEKRWEVRVNHGPKAFHVSSCPALDEKGGVNWSGIGNVTEKAWLA